MKRVIFVFLVLFLLIPSICHAQVIFADFKWDHATDKTIFWVLEDPNGRKYNGTSDIALEQDANVYLQEHMDEWLQAIYIMNTNPDIPDWVDTHLGKYQQALGQINNIDTWAEFQVWAKKITKVFEKINPILD